VKKINVSFILALLVNIGFLLFWLFEKTWLENWLVIGLIFNALIVLFFLSLLFAAIDIWRKNKSKYLYIGLLLNIIGLLMFIVYWLNL
jgi:hypothetical protein